MKKIILASNNQHKIGEIRSILKDLDFDIKSLKDEEIDIEVEEDGETFEENSMKKAKEIAAYLKKKGQKDFIVLADDSGLEVDYLNGKPGIYSARYAGEHGNDEANNSKLLEELKGVPFSKRTARFVCVIALIDNKDNYISIRGEVDGVIKEELSGEKGFGYDPLFYYEPLKKTFSEMSGEEKNKVSHRGEALKKLKEQLKKYR
ncbi:MAG: XTP/dITP diphosphatase [Clostridium sp.]|jgi:XTP/dITP diphosphohydrolase|nr:XTP/dITP diphosphatase [Clostridium sp.]